MAANESRGAQPAVSFLLLGNRERGTWTWMEDLAQDLEDDSFFLFLIPLILSVYHISLISSQPNDHFIFFIHL